MFTNKLTLYVWPVQWDQCEFLHKIVPYELCWGSHVGKLVKACLLLKYFSVLWENWTRFNFKKVCIWHWTVTLWTLTGFMFGEAYLILFSLKSYTPRRYTKIFSTNFPDIFHGKALERRSFEINKEVLALNAHEVSMIAIHLVHDVISKEQKVANFVSSEELLISCNDSCNMYRIYLMNMSKGARKTTKNWLQQRKGKNQFIQQIRKQKKLRRNKEVAILKAQLTESNASRKKISGIH